MASHHTCGYCTVACRMLVMLVHVPACNVVHVACVLLTCTKGMLVCHTCYSYSFFLRVSLFISAFLLNKLKSKKPFVLA